MLVLSCDQMVEAACCLLLADQPGPKNPQFQQKREIKFKRKKRRRKRHRTKKPIDTFCAHHRNASSHRKSFSHSNGFSRCIFWKICQPTTFRKHFLGAARRHEDKKKTKSKKQTRGAKKSPNRYLILFFPFGSDGNKCWYNVQFSKISSTEMLNGWEL